MVLQAAQPRQHRASSQQLKIRQHPSPQNTMEFDLGHKYESAGHNSVREASGHCCEFIHKVEAQMRCSRDVHENEILVASINTFKSPNKETM